MEQEMFESCRDPLALPQPNREIQTLRVGFWEGKVKSMRNLTHDTYELVLECDTDKKIGEAGQFWTIRVPGIRKPRPYSFARAPESENPGEHTFFIRLVPGGELSAWLADGDRSGEQVVLSGPLGKFKLDPSGEDMVCIAGGSGMSAVHAIIEHAANLQVPRNCYFFYGARTQQDLYLEEEIEALQKRWHPDYTLKFHQVLNEEPEDSGWTGGRGLVTDYFKQHYLATGQVDIGRMKAYFCGPPPMIDAGISVLKEAGLSDRDIFYDKFEDARSPLPVIDNTKCVLCDECLMVKPVENCIVEVSSLRRTDGNAPAPGTMDFEKVEPAATAGLYYNTLYINEKECIRCYACVEICPAKAISPEFMALPETLADIID